jgi:hypothetical protein
MTQPSAHKQLETSITKVSVAIQALSKTFEKIAPELSEKDMRKAFHYLHGVFIAAQQRAELDHRIAQGISPKFSLADIELPELPKATWSTAPGSVQITTLPYQVPSPAPVEPIAAIVPPPAAAPVVQPAASPVLSDGTIDLRQVDGRTAAKLIGGRLTKQGKKERKERPRRYKSVKTDLQEDDDGYTPPPSLEASSKDEVDFIDDNVTDNTGDDD